MLQVTGETPVQKCALTPVYAALFWNDWTAFNIQSFAVVPKSAATEVCCCLCSNTDKNWPALHRPEVLSNSAVFRLQSLIGKNDNWCQGFVGVFKQTYNIESNMHPQRHLRREKDAENPKTQGYQ